MNHKPAVRRSALVVAAVALTLGGTALPADAATAAAATVTTNERLAAHIVDEVAEGDAGSFRTFAPDYVDHAVPSLSGRKALAASLRTQRVASPKAATTIYRVVGENDLVFVHSNLRLRPGTRGLAVMDVFRFAGGRVVEHWGGRQDVPATTVSGHDMFGVLSSPVRFGPDPAASAAYTRATLFGMFAAATSGDLAALDRFIQPPCYQHNPTTADGIQALKDGFGPLLTNPDIRLTVVTTLAEGDLVVLHSTIGGPGVDLMTFDVFRVRNQKIVEHWDVIQPGA